MLEFKLIPHDAPAGYDPDEHSSPALSAASVPTISSGHAPSHLSHENLISEQLYAPNPNVYLSPRPSSASLSVSGVSSNADLHPLLPYSGFEHAAPSPHQHYTTSNGRLVEESKSQPDTRDREMSEMSFEEVHPHLGNLSQVQDDGQLVFQDASGEHHHQSQVAMTLEDGSQVAANSQKQSTGSYEDMHSHPLPPSVPPSSSIQTIPTSVEGRGTGVIHPEHTNHVYSHPFGQPTLELQIPKSGMDMPGYAPQEPSFSLPRSGSMDLLHDSEPMGMRGSTHDPAFSPGSSAYQRMARAQDGMGLIYPQHHYYSPISQPDPFPRTPDSVTSTKSATSSYFFPSDKGLVGGGGGGRGAMTNQTLPSNSSMGRYPHTPYDPVLMHSNYSRGTFPPDRALPPSTVQGRPGYGGEDYHAYFYQQSFGEHPAEQLRRRRANTDTVFEDHLAGGRGRGVYSRPPPPPSMRPWNRHSSIEDDRLAFSNPHGSLRGGGGGYDDMVQDYRLSQPAPYMYNQYGGYQRGRVGGPSSMMSGRMGGLPGQVSLSQPEHGMRPLLRSPFTPPRGVLKNRKEQLPRGDVGR